MTLREELEDYVSKNLTDEGEWVGTVDGIMRIIEVRAAALKERVGGILGEELGRLALPETAKDARELAGRIFDYNPEDIEDLNPQWTRACLDYYTAEIEHFVAARIGEALATIKPEVDKQALQEAIAARLARAPSPSVDDLLIQEVYSLREKLKIAVAAIKANDPGFDDRLFVHRLNSVDFDQLMEELTDDPEPRAPSHDLYKTGDADAPEVIKDRNGEVVLDLCRRCGRGEIELSEPCTARAPSLSGEGEAIRLLELWYKWQSESTEIRMSDEDYLAIVTPTAALLGDKHE